jgi:methylmalonyl-CoA mutase
VGTVADPGGGSFALETLTDELARAAWDAFRAIEARGGIVAALQAGDVQASLDVAWRERLASLRDGTRPITGVTSFAEPADDPVPTAAAGVPPAPRPTDPVTLPDPAIANPAGLFLSVLAAARTGASVSALATALGAHDHGERIRVAPLPSRRDAESFEETTVSGSAS